MTPAAVIVSSGLKITQRSDSMFTNSQRRCQGDGGGGDGGATGGGGGHTYGSAEGKLDGDRWAEVHRNLDAFLPAAARKNSV